ncbi:penicillin-binding protein activator [Chitinimonas lacunae]|uniref:Penicillin-binding protein activator n=1 Tax=Chitinimonas lacunae TaxID=1963018 RepID=A0ABV8MJJ2_9NEIS
MHRRHPFARMVSPLVAAALLYLGLATHASAEGPAPAPHLAVILPTKAKPLAGAAEAVHQGVLAAEQKLGDDRTPRVRLYPTGERDDEALVAYQDALRNGAVGVIGPLTRGAIAKLAEFGSPEIPVLALNSVDGDRPVNNLYALGLSIEAESRQVARLMHGEGRRRPLVVETDGPLPKRMRTAFVEEWKLLSGEAPTVASATALGPRLRDSAANPEIDSVFLAADLKKARTARPYLGNDRPVYATSQVWGGKFGKTLANVDLLGVRFVDMPWLLDPNRSDHLPYRRADKSALSADLERFYALGIDAYRLSLMLLVAAPDAAIELQGVTGSLRLSEKRQFSRELSSGEIGGDAPSAPPAEQASTAEAAPVPLAPVQ